ncbi:MULTISPECIES: hypothetical protein [Pantoea]|uniref:hypothetical protein n=1 Tax=Pantoea TaxID=53335 RepID=UPI001680A7C8|nr:MULTISPECIES: hypothetical protein [Pantoea]
MAAPSGISQPATQAGLKHIIPAVDLPGRHRPVHQLAAVRLVVVVGHLCPAVVGHKR